MLDADGTPLRAWGRAGNALGQFGLPRSIAVDRENLVYVSDAQFGNVQVFNDEGKLLMSIGRLSAQNRPGHYSLITGINLDARDYLYVLDQYNGKIEDFKKLSPAEREQKLREHAEGG